MRLPRSRSTARAAFAPGAPMTPPPGWVLEPHMYMPFTGAAILRVARHRPVEQQLIHGQFALEDIAFGKTHFVFDIPGRANFGVQNQFFEVGAVPAQWC